MRLKQLHLQNIRSYAEQTIEFPEGTILVYGKNGAGKTSLLMGVFGGLFLSEIRNVGTNSFDLDEFVRRGENKGVVELVFEVGGIEYTVEWKLYTTSTPNTATLASPDLENTVSGIRDVRREVTRLLGMDEEDFASSVYVKQGEIDRLIDASNRAEMIDGLLGLDKIDDYIAAMKLARRGAGRVQTRNNDQAGGYRHDLHEDYDRDEDEFETKLGELDDDIRDVESDIETVEEYLNDLNSRRAELESDIENYEEIVEQKESKERQIKDTTEKRAAEQRQIEDRQTTISTLNEEITGLKSEIDDRSKEVDYDVDTAEAAADASDAVQEELKAASIKQTNRENELEQAEGELADLELELESAETEREELNDKLDALKDEIEQRQTDLDTAEDDLVSSIADRDASTVEYVPSIASNDIVDADSIDAVQNRIKDLEERHTDTTTTLAQIRTMRDERKSDLTDERETLEETNAKLNEQRNELVNLRSERDKTKERLEAVTEEFDARLDALSKRGTEVEVIVSAEDLQVLADNRLPDLQEAVNTDLGDVGNRIAALKQRLEGLTADLEEMHELEAENKCPRCKQPVDEAHIEDEVTEIETELTETREHLKQAQTERQALEDKKDAIVSLRDTVLELIQFRNQQVKEAKAELEAFRETVGTLEDEIADREDDVSVHEAEIDALETKVGDLNERIDDLESERDELTRNIDTGNSIVVQFERVAEKREHVNDIIDTIEDLRNDIDDINADIEVEQERIQSLKTGIEEQQGAVDECATALTNAEEHVESLETTKETVDELECLYDEIYERESQIESEQQSINHHHQTIETLNEQLAGIQQERDELEATLGDTDIEELEHTLGQIEERIGERQQTRSDRQERAQTLRDERTALQNQLSNLRDLKDRIDTYERRAKWAMAVHDELDTIISVYESVKSDLREKYLAYINQYTNDIFQEVYLNSSYQRVVISEIYNERRDSYDYDIHLLRDDGMTEDPSNASGGERAIVNLALRAGIYKLIAELDGGDRGRLPPFILDEPTTFLDDGHVGQLEEMLNKIKEWDVPQVIVVSHNEALIHGADHACRIEIDEATNTSTVTMRTAGAD